VVIDETVIHPLNCVFT